MSEERGADDARIAMRWAEFLEHVWAVSADQGWNADEYVHPDLPARTVRARLHSDRSDDTSFAVTLSRAQLLEGDLQDLARRFVVAFVVAFDASWPQRDRRE